MSNLNRDEWDIYASIVDDKEKRENFFFEMYEKYMWHSIESTGMTREEFWEDIRKLEHEYIKSKEQSKKK